MPRTPCLGFRQQEGVHGVCTKLGEEIRTNVGSDSGKYHLTFTSRLHCSSKVGIVPGIDLTVAANERCVGIHAGNLFW